MSSRPVDDPFVPPAATALSIDQIKEQLFAPASQEPGNLYANEPLSIEDIKQRLFVPTAAPPSITEIKQQLFGATPVIPNKIALIQQKTAEKEALINKSKEGLSLGGTPYDYLTPEDKERAIANYNESVLQEEQAQQQRLYSPEAIVSDRSLDDIGGAVSNLLFHFSAESAATAEVLFSTFPNALRGLEELGITNEDFALYNSIENKLRTSTPLSPAEEDFMNPRITDKFNKIFEAATQLEITKTAQEGIEILRSRVNTKKQQEALASLNAPLEKAYQSFADGEILEGIGDFISAVATMASKHPQGSAEVIIGTVPQMAVLARSAVLGVSSLASTGYQEAVDEFVKEHGRQPNVAEKAFAALLTTASAALDVIGAKFITGAKGIIKATRDAARKVGIAAPAKAVEGTKGAIRRAADITTRPARGFVVEAGTEGTQKLLSEQAYKQEDIQSIEDLAKLDLKGALKDAAVGGLAGFGISTGVNVLPAAAVTAEATGKVIKGTAKGVGVVTGKGKAATINRKIKEAKEKNDPTIGLDAIAEADFTKLEDKQKKKYLSKYNLLLSELDVQLKDLKKEQVQDTEAISKLENEIKRYEETRNNIITADLRSQTEGNHVAAVNALAPPKTGLVDDLGKPISPETVPELSSEQVNNAVDVVLTNIDTTMDVNKSQVNRLLGSKYTKDISKSKLARIKEYQTYLNATSRIESEAKKVEGVTLSGTKKTLAEVHREVIKGNNKFAGIKSQMNTAIAAIQSGDQKAFSSVLTHLSNFRNSQIIKAWKGWEKDGRYEPHTDQFRALVKSEVEALEAAINQVNKMGAAKFKSDPFKVKTIKQVVQEYKKTDEGKAIAAVRTAPGPLPKKATQAKAQAKPKPKAEEPSKTKTPPVPTEEPIIPEPAPPLTGETVTGQLNEAVPAPTEEPVFVTPEGEQEQVLPTLKSTGQKSSKKKPVLTGPKSSEHQRPKDQAKSDQANKFIGFGQQTPEGEPVSSTAHYQRNWGANANTGVYEASDKVFVSMEGRRANRISIKKNKRLRTELLRAIKAGATLIADNAKNREENNYNVGERELAAFLAGQGYQEVDPGSGIWTPIEAVKAAPSTLEEITDVPPILTTESINAVTETVNKLNFRKDVKELFDSTMEALKKIKQKVALNKTVSPTEIQYAQNKINTLWSRVFKKTTAQEESRKQTGTHTQEEITTDDLPVDLLRDGVVHNGPLDPGEKLSDRKSSKDIFVALPEDKKPNILRRVKKLFSRLFVNGQIDETVLKELPKLSKKQKDALPLLNFFYTKFNELLIEGGDGEQTGLIKNLVKPVLFENDFEGSFADPRSDTAGDPFTYLIQVDAAGNRYINENIIAAMAVVALDWTTTQANETLYNDETDINKILHRDEEAWLNDAAKELAYAGIPQNALVEMLGPKAFKLTGLKVRDDYQDGEFQSRLEMAMGAWIVSALLHGGVVTQKEFTANDIAAMKKDDTAEEAAFSDAAFDGVVERMEDDKQLPANFIRLVSNQAPGEKISTDPAPAIQKFKDIIADSEGVIETLFGIESTDVYPKFGPIKSVVKKVQRSLMDVPEQLRQKIARMQETKWGMRHDMLKLFDFIGEEQFLNMHGFVSDDDLLQEHVTREKAIEGKNRSIKQQIDNFNKFRKVINSLDPNLDFYFSYKVLKNNRVDIESNILDPQKNKIQRHLIAPKNFRVTIDTDQKLQYFQAAVMAALPDTFKEEGQRGFSLDNTSFEEINALFTELTEGNSDQAKIIQEGVAAINRVLIGKKQTEEQQQSDKDAIAAAVKLGGEETHSLDGLLALREYSRREANGSFVTDIGIETDGITNGVMIGLMQSMQEGNMGQKLAASGGYTDGVTKTNSQYKKASPLNRDHYENLAVSWAANLAEPIVNYFKNNKALKTNEDVSKAFAFSDRIFGNIVDPDNQTIVTTLGRTLSKDPLMIYNYGAGIKSIVSALTNTAVNNFYDQLMKASKEENAKEAIDELVEQFNLFANSDFAIKNYEDIRNEKLNTKQERALRNAVRKTHGKALREALDAQFRGFKKFRETIAAALTTMFEAFNIKYEEAVNARLEEINKDRQEVDRIYALSPREEEKIFMSLADYYPAIRSPLSSKDGKFDRILAMKRDKSRAINDPYAQTQIKYNHPVRGTNNKNSMTGTISRYSHIEPGVSGLIKMIQSFDSANIADVYASYAMLSLYDAGLYSIEDVLNGTASFNESFAQRNASYRIIDEVYESLGNVVEKIKQDPILHDKLNERIAQNEHLRPSEFAEDVGFLEEKFTVADVLAQVLNQKVLTRIGQENTPLTAIANASLPTEEATYVYPEDYEIVTEETISEEHVQELLDMPLSELALYLVLESTENIPYSREELQEAFRLGEREITDYLMQQDNSYQETPIVQFNLYRDLGAKLKLYNRFAKKSKGKINQLLQELNNTRDTDKRKEINNRINNEKASYHAYNMTIVELQSDRRRMVRAYPGVQAANPALKKQRGSRVINHLNEGTIGLFNYQLKLMPAPMLQYTLLNYVEKEAAITDPFDSEKLILRNKILSIKEEIQLREGVGQFSDRHISILLSNRVSDAKLKEKGLTRSELVQGIRDSIRGHSLEGTGPLQTIVNFLQKKYDEINKLIVEIDRLEAKQLKNAGTTKKDLFNIVVSFAEFGEKQLNNKQKSLLKRLQKRSQAREELNKKELDKLKESLAKQEEQTGKGVIVPPALSTFGSVFPSPHDPDTRTQIVSNIFADNILRTHAPADIRFADTHSNYIPEIYAPRPDKEVELINKAINALFKYSGKEITETAKLMQTLLVNLLRSDTKLKITNRLPKEITYESAGVLGAFIAEINTLAVDINREALESTDIRTTVLHELIHAATVYGLFTAKNEGVAAYNNLIDLIIGHHDAMIKKLMKEPNNEITHGLMYVYTQPHPHASAAEMLAVFFSHPQTFKRWAELIKEVDPANAEPINSVLFRLYNFLKGKIAEFFDVILDTHAKEGIPLTKGTAKVYGALATALDLNNLKRDYIPSTVPGIDKLINYIENDLTQRDIDLVNAMFHATSKFPKNRQNLLNMAREYKTKKGEVKLQTTEILEAVYGTGLREGKLDGRLQAHDSFKYYGSSYKQKQYKLNFTREDLIPLDTETNLEAMKEKAIALIDNPEYRRPMKRIKINYFTREINRSNKPSKILQMMYNIKLAGEGLPVIGPNKNAYQNLFEDILGSSGVSIDMENFAATYESTLTGDNSLQIFEDLANLGNVQAPSEWQGHLKGLLSNLVNKVIKPLDGKPLEYDFKLNEEGDVVHGAIDVEASKIRLQAPPGALVGDLSQMSAQEVMVHEMLHAITKYVIDTNIDFRNRLEKLFLRAKERITPEDFLHKDAQGNVIFKVDEAAERAAAQERYDYIFNNPEGNNLHEFLAFGLSNQKFNQLLGTVPPPAKVKVKLDITSVESIKAAIAALFENMMTFLGRKITGLANLNADQELLKLTETIVEMNRKNTSRIFKWIDAIHPLNNAATQRLQKHIFAPIGRWHDKYGQKPNKSIIGSTVSLAVGIPRVIAQSIRSDDFYKAISKTRKLLGLTEKSLIMKWIREVAGISKHTLAWHLLLKESKKFIDQQRKHITDLVHEQVKNEFHLPVSDEEAEALTRVILKTDLHSIFETYSLDTIQNMLSSNVPIDREIKRLKDSLKPYRKNGTYYWKQAESLGHLMAKGSALRDHTMLNAHNIANMTSIDNPTLIGDLGQAETIVDMLATLYALKFTQKSQKELVSNVMKREYDINSSENGIINTVFVHGRFKRDSLKDSFDGQKALMLKGYTHEILNPDIDFMVGTIEDKDAMEAKGYYQSKNFLTPDQIDPDQSKRIMYVSKMSPLNSTVKGVASLTNEVAKGTNLYKSYTEAGHLAASLDAIQATKDIKDANNKKVLSDQFDETKDDADLNNNFLVPITNNKGKIVGYRYMMSETVKQTLMEKKDNLFTVMGRMHGGIVDKVESKKMNRRVIEQAYADYIRYYNEDPSNFVELSENSKDPRYREIYTMMPESMKRDIKEVWPVGDKIYVREDLIDLIFGYRKLSVADFWPIKNFSETNLGKYLKADLHIRQAERIWQEIVGVVKDYIVVKTGSVLRGNINSNNFILWSRGVPAEDILKHQIEAIEALRTYQEKLKRYDTLKVKIESTPLSAARIKEIKAEMVLLEDGLNNNPVKFLLDKGLFQTIVEDIDIIDDEFSFKSKLIDKIGPKAEDHLPEVATEAVKQAYLQKETYAYKKLLQATQYSDFVARYALYKHDINNKGMSSLQAQVDAMETFINYDVPTAPSIQYINDMGFFMFTKFLFRIQKIILKMFKDNPVNALAIQGVQSLTDYNFSDIYDNNLITGFNPERLDFFVGTAENLTKVPVVEFTENIMEF